MQVSASPAYPWGRTYIRLITHIRNCITTKPMMNPVWMIAAPADAYHPSGPSVKCPMGDVIVRKLRGITRRLSV